MRFLPLSDTVGRYVIMFCVTVIQVTIYDKRCGHTLKKSFIIIPSKISHRGKRNNTKTNAINCELEPLSKT